MRSEDLEFRAQGLGLGAWGLELGAWGLGLGLGVGFGVVDLVFRVQCFGTRAKSRSRGCDYCRCAEVFPKVQ